jgi:hypothetical protein
MGDNAVTSVPVYQAADVLTAANLNITNSGIPVFSGTATRDDAFGGSGEKVLAEGQFAYLEDSNTPQYYDGAAWVGITGGVVQVKSATKTDTFTMTSSTYADITGVTISITPTSASNKVFVIATIVSSQQVATNNGFIRLARGGTAIGVGDAEGSRIQATSPTNAVNSDFPVNLSVSFLDAPATTSATTYSAQIKNNGSGTMYVNRSQSDTNSTSFGRYSSTITVFEVTP